MSRLTALVPAAVCARAVARDWPDDLDGQVRCIDEGTRALGLAYCCAPWSTDAEDAALRAELGDPADAGAGWPETPPAPAAAGRDPSLVSLAPRRGRARAGPDSDAVAAGLARVPGAFPVVGLVSGPLTWSIRVRSAAPSHDAVDAASDLASARIRDLAGCGVKRVVVIESTDSGSFVNDELALEAHRPIVRSADHLRVEVILVSTHAATRMAARLAYERWAGPDGCSDGLALLPSAAFASTTAMARCVERRAVQLVSADTVLTADLDADVDPDVVRYAVGLVATPDGENRAGENRDGENPA